MRTNNPNQRRDGESFRDYRDRLREQQFNEKHRQPRVLWDCRQGTYRRDKHGPLN